MSDKTKALLLSFFRIFGAALLAAFLQLGKAPLDLEAEDLKSLANAAIGALALTLFNYFRQGETRFGRGSKDIGMGGDDTLEPGGKIQTPTGPIDDPVVFVPSEDVPVQTDNTERPEDGVQDVSQDPNDVYGSTP